MTPAKDLSTATWHKSSYSFAETNCVEVARLPERIALRDSKNPHATHLGFDRAAWVAFLGHLRREH